MWPYCSEKGFNSVIAEYNRVNKSFALVGKPSVRKALVIERIDHIHTVLDTMTNTNYIPPVTGEAKATYKDELLIVGGKSSTKRMLDQVISNFFV